MSEKKKLRFTEYVEFVLARLYELDTGDGKYIDVKTISEELKEPVPEFWPFEAVQVLAQRGLVQDLMAMSVADAYITGAGRLFVEEQERLRSSTIHAYLAHPAHFVIVEGTGNQVVVGSEGISQATTPRDGESR